MRFDGLLKKRGKSKDDMVRRNNDTFEEIQFIREFWPKIYKMD